MTPAWLPSTAWLRSRTVLLAAAWFALLAGTARAGHYAVMRWLTDAFQWTGDHVMWMAPLAHVMIFAVPAVLLAALAAFVPRLVPARLVVGLFATAAAFSFLLLFPRLHHLASLALAIGVSLRLTAWVVRNPARARQLAWWSGGGLAAASGVLASLALLGESASERRAMAALPPPAEGAPNILLLILDTVRSSSMHLYGLPRPNTPHIERLAADGVVFERAVATTSWTLPTHVTLLSGRYPTGFAADWLAPMDDSVPHLAEVLSRRGFATGAFVANLNYTTRETGLARGFARWRDYRRTTRELLLSSSLLQSDLVRDLRAAAIARNPLEALKALARFRWSSSDRYLGHDRKPADVVVDEFLAWEGGVDGRPWFAMLNFFDAHAPYKPLPPFDTMFAAGGPTAAYEGAIATIDRELGRLFDTLRARGAYDRTIVVVTSDHGELFGEHAMWEHGDHLYLPLLHVPLVIRAPGGLPGGVRVPFTVSLRDVPATLLDLAGVAREATPIAGISLRRLANGTGSTERSAAAASLTRNSPRRSATPPALRYVSLVDDSLQLIIDGRGTGSLYDLRTDPDQARDLLAGDDGAPHAARMRQRLMTILGRSDLARRSSP
jgi:arylsulfatase A-like enzyme